MSDTDQMTDSAELHELRDSLSGVAMPERPRLEAITARGRARRRHRLSRAAGLSVAGVAAGTALALGLTGAHGPAPVHGTIRPGPRHDPDRRIQDRQEIQRQGHADPQPERVPRPGDPAERPRQIRHPGEGHLRQLLLLRSRAGRLFAGRVLAATRGVPCRRNPVCSPLLPSTRRPCQRAQSSASASSSSPAAGSRSPSR